ncbi:MAG: winged helix-turn-helix transcriptional regulator [Zoogloeaceae bacterium]|nr:winged helix-turn-helix transcriptional regulator [Zoogloeaceae bacterium]
MNEDAPGREADEGETAAAGRFVDNYLPYLLAQASSRVSREFHREVEAAGLSVTEWRVLASLEGSDGESIGVLSQLTLTKQPTLSKVVLRMEANDIVARTRVRSDRRQTVVRITRKGNRLTEALRARALAHQQRILAPFGPDNAEKLISMLRALLALHPPEEGGGEESPFD